MFPWYDSDWLINYVRAKEYLRERHPRQLDDFIAAFDVLRTDPEFEVRSVTDLISCDDHDQLVRLVETERLAPREKHELLSFGRVVLHNDAFCTDLGNRLTDRVSELVNQQVEQRYTFLSMYTNLGICPVHLDAPSAKWTVDYCIQQSAPWPIHLSQVRPWPEDWEGKGDWNEAIRIDPGNRFTAYTLDEGEAIVFGGSSQWHYRDRIERPLSDNYCHLAFFHYVPVGTAHLIDTAQWPAFFGVPDLAQAFVDFPRADRSVIGG